MDHRKVRKIYWICWLLASVIVVLGALLPDEKMQKIVIAIGIIIVIFGNIIAICFMRCPYCRGLLNLRRILTRLLSVLREKDIKLMKSHCG